MFNKHITLLLCACALACTQSITANVVWPALFIKYAIIQVWFLIGISILIEAAVFYLYLKDISYFKALLMSLTGNATLLGFFIAFGPILALAKGLVDDLVTWLYIKLPESYLFLYVMMLGLILLWATVYFISVIIERFTIKLLFKYPAEKLWDPLLISKLISYGLIPLVYSIIVLKNHMS